MGDFSIKNGDFRAILNYQGVILNFVTKKTPSDDHPIGWCRWCSPFETMEHVHYYGEPALPWISMDILQPLVVASGRASEWWISCSFLIFFGGSWAKRCVATLFLAVVWCFRKQPTNIFIHLRRQSCRKLILRRISGRPFAAHTTGTSVL